MVYIFVPVFVIILLRKGELVALLFIVVWLWYVCVCQYVFHCLFLMVPLVGLCYLFELFILIQILKVHSVRKIIFILYPTIFNF